MSQGDSPAFTQEFLNRSSLEDVRLLSADYWGELRVFLAVAKSGSYSRAAELLATSQPTVSRQVKRLQDVMGAQLVVSSPAGVLLTQRGKALAQKLASLDHDLFSMSNDLKSETKSLKGTVRISITDGLAVFFLVPALRQFSVEHPLLQVDIQSPLNLNDLRQNQTDMMIGFAPSDAADVTCRELGFLHLIPIVAHSYIERHGLPTQANLQDHFFIQSRLYQSESPLWAPWNKLAQRGRIVHSCDSSLAMLEPAARPVDPTVRVSLRMYASVLTERLESRPAKVAFEWMCSVFGVGNPWFQEEPIVTPRPSVADEGFRIMFNLPNP